MKCFNVGILGTGSIAQSMAFTLNVLKDKGEVVPYAIASRSLKKAENSPGNGILKSIWQL